MTNAYEVRAPSNIALVKYWGKLAGHDQVAANSSLSMTLSHCQAVTTCQLLAKGSTDHELRFAGDAVGRADKGGAKIFAHLDRMAAFGQQLDGGAGPARHFAVATHNTFPTSAGIASSAAGLSALTIAAAAAWRDTASWPELAEGGFSRPVLADLARLGSGSAGRSLFGGFVTWQSGAEAAAAPQRIAPIQPAEHWPLCDTIAVLSTGEKAVSSTAAHREVWTSPLFALRLATLPTTLAVIEKAIASKDIAALGEAIEQEAINMHSVSMTAKEPITFPSPASFALMTALKGWRRKTGLKAYFTLDAGENVHIIHEPDQLGALKAHLAEFAGIRELIYDRVGTGPTLSRAEKMATRPLDLR